MMNNFRVIGVLIVTVLIVAPVTYGKDCAAPADDGRNPYPTGGGYIAAGIVVSAVTVPVALVSGFLAGESAAECGTKSEDEPRCKREGHGWRVGGAVAGTIALSGLTLGISTIGKGITKKRRYKQWERECRPQLEEEARLTGPKFKTVIFEPVGDDGVKLGLSWEF